MNNDRKILLGILAGLASGVLWGLVFLIPQLLPDFRPLEITFGRFFFFGLLSLFYIAPVIRILRQLSLKDMLQVFLLSAVGFWLYTVFVVWAIQINGGVVTALVIGLLPITISLAGKKSWRMEKQFVMGLGFILLGLIVLKGVPMLLNTGGANTFSLAGILLLLACLGMWTWYAVKNSAFLKVHHSISKRDFTSVIGVVSLVCVSVLSCFLVDVEALVQHERFPLYVGLTAVMGLGSTWLAYWLWNICAAFCPPQVAGPLIVSETVFGILFTVIYQGRLPTIAEGLGAIFFGLGAFLSIRSEMRQPILSTESQ